MLKHFFSGNISYNKWLSLTYHIWVHSKHQKNKMRKSDEMHQYQLQQDLAELWQASEHSDRQK